MGTWVRVDRDRLYQPREEEIGGVKVTVYFSPYDVPELLGGDYDPDRRRFVVRFRYPGGQEPLSYKTQDGNVRLGLGKVTGRVHEIEIDVDRIQASAVRLNMNVVQSAFEEAERAIRRLQDAPATTTTPEPNRMSNYVAASEALDQQREQVFGCLTALESASPE